jgi:hypothetical protein
MWEGAPRRAAIQMLITEPQRVLVSGKLAAHFRGQFRYSEVEVMKLRAILQFSPGLIATLTHQRDRTWQRSRVTECNQSLK